MLQSKSPRLIFKTLKINLISEKSLILPPPSHLLNSVLELFGRGQML